MIPQIYYTVKPLIPRKMQIGLRRVIARRKRVAHVDTWPIDKAAGQPPQGWCGWPEGKQFALVLSHDVDTQKGHDQVLDLLAIEKKMGFSSAFNFVPERYRLSPELIEAVKREGCEVNIHGLKHDGKLFKNRSIFEERAVKINRYIEAWQSDGFTAPSMICRLDWIHLLNITHSTCTFDTDPFEPQPNPSQTIFPFVVKNGDANKGIVELPYTLAQDHTLFIILQEKDISIWKEKLAWIAQKGGLALLNTHPDYMRFSDGKPGLEEYPVQLYADFLNHLKREYQGRYWHALPAAVGDYIQTQRIQ